VPAEVSTIAAVRAVDSWARVQAQEMARRLQSKLEG